MEGYFPVCENGLHPVLLRPAIRVQTIAMSVSVCLSVRWRIPNDGVTASFSETQRFAMTLVSKKRDIKD